MSNWRERVRLHALSQVVIQLMTFLSGVLVVNALMKPEYAAYSVVIRVIAAVSYVADSGASALLLQRAARVSSVAERDVVFGSFAILRRWISLLVSGMGLAWVAVLLYANNVHIAEIIPTVVVTALILTPTLSVASFQVFHRIHYDLRPLRTAMFVSGLVRLVGAGALFWLHVTSESAWLGLMVVTAWGTFAFLRRTSAREGLRLGKRSDAEIGRFRRAWVGVLPLTLVLITGEQATVAIASYRGSPAVVADLSALSRFAVLFAIVNAIVTDVLGPIVARSPETKQALLRRFGLFLGCYVAMIAALVIATRLAASPLLFLLGHQYSGLEGSLAVVAGGTGLINMGHDLNTLTVSRGWTGWVWLYAALSILWLGWAAFAFPIHDVLDVAIIYTVQAVPMSIVQLVRVACGIRRAPHEKVLREA